MLYGSCTEIVWGNRAGAYKSLVNSHLVYQEHNDNDYEQYGNDPNKTLKRPSSRVRKKLLVSTNCSYLSDSSLTGLLVSVADPGDTRTG